MRDEILAIYDFVWVAHEVFQEPELFEGEGHFLAVLGHLVLHRIKFDVVSLEDCRQRFRWSAQYSLDASDELIEGKRLHHVVVSPSKKKFYLMFGFVSRC